MGPGNPKLLPGGCVFGDEHILGPSLGLMIDSIQGRGFPKGPHHQGIAIAINSQGHRGVL